MRTRRSLIGSWYPEPVAQEQVASAASQPEQLRAERPILQQVGALDEREPLVELASPDEQRRDREEELVDEPCGEEPAGRARSALGEDQPGAAGTEQLERRASVELGAGPERHGVDVGAELRGARVGSEHERVRREGWVAGVDRPASAEHDEL